MNYLAHIHLAGEQPLAQLGGLYGDFIKGPLTGEWPASIEAGIRQHRRIDLFTDSHPLVIQARSRFPSGTRRISGVLLDVFFDHCLALDWARYADEPLELFTARFYQLLASQPLLPGRLSEVAPRMIADDWLASYADFAVIERVLGSIERRLSRPGLLLPGLIELERLYQPLVEDFHALYPQLQKYARVRVST